VPRRWRLIGLVACTVTLAACGSSAAGPTRTSTINPASIDAIICPNTWQLTSIQRGLNPGTSQSTLAAHVIPPHALWVAFCLYGEPSSATSNAGGTETLVQEGGTLASKQQKLIGEINNGQVVKAPGTSNCLADNGQTYLLMFSYHHAPTVKVAASLFGCRFITNGVTTVNSPKATARLLAMAGTHTQGGPPLPTPTTGP
jgi:hypothetical protein